MTQEDFLNYTLDLKRANPSMDIHFCMDSENAREYGWLLHQITEVKICPWYETAGGEILTNETDIKLDIEGYGTDRFDPDESFEVAMKRINDAYQEKTRQAVCVFTAATYRR